MNVRTIKLATGDELIFSLIEVGTDVIVAEDVVILQHIQDPATGKSMMGFGDYPAIAKPKQRQEIRLSAVMIMPLEAHEELERQYLANVTGLELPPAQKKIILS